MANVLEATTSEQLDPQALIQEARRHQRRRLAALGVAVLLVAATIAFLTLGRGGSASSTSSSPYGPPASVIARAGLARIAFSYRDSTTGGCIPDTNSPVTSGTGSIDLVEHSLSFITVTRGCSDLIPRQAKGAERWIQGVLYTLQTAPDGTAHWTVVPRRSLASVLGFNPLQALLNSPWALSVANLARRSEHRSGSTSINGEPVIKYAGVTTLLAVEGQLESVLDAKSISLAPGDDSSVVPTPDSVPISVALWTNQENQILRIQVTEPLYTGVYRNGSDTENAIQVPADTLSTVGLVPGKPVPRAVPNVPLRTLRQQSSFEMTLSFSSFGSAPAIVRPT
jgi:hypothetical protein